MDLNEEEKKQLKAHFMSFMDGNDFNLSRVKAFGYSLASFDDSQYFDQHAKKLSLVLKRKKIDRLYVFEVGDLKTRSNFEISFETSVKGIESSHDFIKYPQWFNDWIFFSEDLKVMIFRPTHLDTSYFCGDEDFIKDLTSSEITPDFERVK